MSKKQKCPEFENHERWLVSFADMMTLLFALFVVLFALKEGSDEKMEQAAAAMQETFNAPMETIPIDRRVLPNEMGMGIFDHMRGDSIRPSSIKKFPGSRERIRIIDDEAKRVQVDLEERLYGPNKLPDPDKTGQERIVSVHRTADGITLRLLARHFYAPGSHVVRRAALRELDELAVVLKDIGRPITIEGHTDSIPPRGSTTNWDLSSMRASSVLNYFVKQHNFPTSTLSVAGYADTRPIASNGTEGGRSLNRRIEIKIHYDE